MPYPTVKRIPAALRDQIWSRDNKQCTHCHAEVDKAAACIDRKTAKVRYSSKPEDLITLCRRCYVLHDMPGRQGMIADALGDGVIPPDYRSLVWED